MAVWVRGTAGGLSALVATSETAFQIVKYLGAGYLGYLGIRRPRIPAGSRRRRA